MNKIVAITWDKQKRTIGNITQYVSSSATVKTPIKRDGETLEEFLVTSIQEHSCRGEGDKWYWDIHINDGGTLRIFNPEEVLYADTLSE